MVERQLCKLDVVGSIPISSTRFDPGLDPGQAVKVAVWNWTLKTEYEG